MAVIPTVVAGAASAAALNSLTFSTTFTAAVNVGDSVIVKLGERHLVSAPLNPSVTDTGGNTWTRLDFGGNAAAQLATFLTTVTTAIQVGDTLTATYTTNNCDEILITAEKTAGFSLAVSALGTISALATATVHTKSSTAVNTTDFVHGGDLSSGGTAAQFSSVSANGTFLQVVGTPANRALATFYNNPGVTSAVSTSVTWTVTHTGSMDAIAYVATLSGSSASGSLTLGGSAAAAAPVSATGAITLGGGSSTAQATTTASGSLTLGGAVSGQAGASASGSITLTGTATALGPGSTASGSLTLGGTVAAVTPITASGSLTLGGTATARATLTAAGSLTLGGALAATGNATSAGSLTLGGSLTAQAAATITGSLTLGGTATASSGSVLVDITVYAGAPYTAWSSNTPSTAWAAQPVST